MNWYKESNQIPLQIASYSNDGILTVYFGPRRYQYTNISNFLYRQLEALLKHKNYSAASKILHNCKLLVHDTEIKNEPNEQLNLWN